MDNDFEEISKRLIKVISETLRVPVENIALENDYYRDLSADSLDLIRVLMSVEKEFDISIFTYSDDNAEHGNVPEEYVDQFRTVAGTLEFVKQKVGEQSLVLT